MPDLFVSADTSETSAFLSELFFSGTLNQFAFDVADRDRNKLLAYGSSKAFDARYNVSSPLFDELVDFAKKQGVASTASDIVRSRKTIGTRLKASIARNVWGNVGYYGSLLESDRIFQEADSMLRSGQ